VTHVTSTAFAAILKSTPFEWGYLALQIDNVRECAQRILSGPSYRPIPVLTV